jgi:predicted TIM-barrel fold metal-dependent hydrolase
MAVLLAWDAETATGRPRVPNETVAAACRDHPSVFTGLGSVDPHKGPAAVAEVANIARLGLHGVKFHPSLQAFERIAPRGPLGGPRGAMAAYLPQQAAHSRREPHTAAHDEPQTTFMLVRAHFP